MSEQKRMSSDELQRRRRAAGLTQNQLAKKVGISRMTLNAWESGRYGIPAPAALAVRHVLGEKYDTPAAQQRQINLMDSLRSRPARD